MMLISSICLCLFIFVRSDHSISEIFSLNTEHGVFGCFSYDKLYISFLLVGPISGLIGNGGYVLINKYFEPHISAIFFLLQPAVSQFLGLMLGLDKMPGMMTWIGFFFTVVSIYIVTMGSRIRIKQNE
jgi:drug/metabolite transporter (DMT)-like permease